MSSTEQELQSKLEKLRRERVIVNDLYWSMRAVQFQTEKIKSHYSDWEEEFPSSKKPPADKIIPPQVDSPTLSGMRRRCENFEGKIEGYEIEIHQIQEQELQEKTPERVEAFKILASLDPKTRRQLELIILNEIKQ